MLSVGVLFYGGALIFSLYQLTLPVGVGILTHTSALAIIIVASIIALATMIGLIGMKATPLEVGHQDTDDADKWKFTAAKSMDKSIKVFKLRVRALPVFGVCTSLTFAVLLAGFLLGCMI